MGPETHALGLMFTINEGHGQTLDLHRSTSLDGGRTRASHAFVTDQKGIYSSDMWSNEAVRQINLHSSTTPKVPLFLYVAFTTIHTPLMVDERYIQQNQHMTGSDEIRMNAGMMTSMDEGYGRIVTALKTNQMYENTIVLTFSDNGGLVFQGSSNFPLRGQKMGPWEGGIRSVAFVTGGHVSLRNHLGTSSNAMLHAVDLHTLALHWAAPTSPLVEAKKEPRGTHAFPSGTSGGSKADPEAGSKADPEAGSKADPEAGSKANSKADTLHSIAASFSRPPYPSKTLDATNGKTMFRAILDAHRSSPRTGFVSLLDEVGAFEFLQQAQMNSMLGQCVAVRMGKWKMIEGHPGRDDWYPADPSRCFDRLIHEGTISTPPYETKECIRGDFRYENVGTLDQEGRPFVPKSLWLFNIEKDPSERHDVSDQHPDLVQQMRKEIQHHVQTSVPSFPDRWASLAGMMVGNFHTVAPGNGYEAGLANWMEEDHLQSISFYTKAKAWIRQQFIEAGMWVTNKGRVHRQSTAGSSFFSNDVAFMRRMTKDMKWIMGKEFQDDFTQKELVKLQMLLTEKEKEGKERSGGRRKWARSKM